MAEAFLVTLMGSPLFVMGISDLSMMYRQASRTPWLNWRREKKRVVLTTKAELLPSGYLSVVPLSLGDVVVRAVVNDAQLVHHAFLPLRLVVQEHAVG